MQTFEILFENEESFLLKAFAVHDRYSEDEMETRGFKAFDPGSYDVDEVLIDLKLVGVAYATRCKQLDGATFIVDYAGDQVTVFIPFEDFIRVYVGYLKKWRSAKLVLVESTGAQ